MHETFPANEPHPVHEAHSAYEPNQVVESNLFHKTNIFPENAMHENFEQSTKYTALHDYDALYGKNDILNTSNYDNSYSDKTNNAFDDPALPDLHVYDASAMDASSDDYDNHMEKKKQYSENDLPKSSAITNLSLDELNNLSPAQVQAVPALAQTAAVVNDAPLGYAPAAAVPEISVGQVYGAGPVVQEPAVQAVYEASAVHPVLQHNEHHFQPGHEAVEQYNPLGKAKQ